MCTVASNSDEILKVHKTTLLAAVKYIYSVTMTSFPINLLTARNII